MPAASKGGELIYGQTQPMNFGACVEYVVVAGKYCMPVLNGVKLEDASTVGIAALMAY
jgi:NADPH:quinone reductase-like Zn-dependent oxidoreductase